MRYRWSHFVCYKAECVIRRSQFVCVIWRSHFVCYKAECVIRRSHFVCVIRRSHCVCVIR